jgi:hypothetical protein
MTEMIFEGRNKKIIQNFDLNTFSITLFETRRKK